MSAGCFKSFSKKIASAALLLLTRNQHDDFCSTTVKAVARSIAARTTGVAVALLGAYVSLRRHFAIAAAVARHVLAARLRPRFSKADARKRRSYVRHDYRSSPSILMPLLLTRATFCRFASREVPVYHRAIDDFRFASLTAISPGTRRCGRCAICDAPLISFTRPFRRTCHHGIWTSAQHGCYKYGSISLILITHFL